jgi:hypothetical protein
MQVCTWIGSAGLPKSDMYRLGACLASLYADDDKMFGQEPQVAHYFRIKEIYAGRYYSAYDTRPDEPSGPLLDVQWHRVYPIDPKASLASYPRGSLVHARATKFNQIYGLLLNQIERAFNGEPEMMRQAAPTMLALKYTAQELVRNPHPDPKFASKDISASPTFEVQVQEIKIGRDVLTSLAAEQQDPAIAYEPGFWLDRIEMATAAGE